MKNSTLQALLGTLVGYLLIVSGLHLSEVILKQNMTAVDLGLFTAQNYSYQNAAQVSLAFYYDYFSGRDPNINAMAVPTGVETVFGG